MADDFLATLGVADPAEPKAGKSKAPDNLDAALRTVWAEASSPEERRWIAGVIANRAKGGAKSLGDVVKEPGQFEPWMSKEGRKRLDSLDPNSDDYQKLLEDVGPILRGEKDPSGGATHFYAPKAQADLAAKDGRPVKPSFDDGNGVDVGSTRFFGGTAKAPDEFLSALGVDPSAAAKAADDDTSEQVKFVGLPKNATSKQAETWLTLHRGGMLDTKAAPGSEHYPMGIQPGMTEKDVPAGAYYIPPEGGLKRAPGGDKESSAVAGLGQGVGDVFTSLSHIVPGTDDSDIKNTMIGSQMLYGAKYGGDLKSGGGRFLGQMIGSAPLIAGGEALAAPALAAAGAPGAFAAGEGGLNMAPSALRLLTRGGSLATRGAIQGGQAAALTSSADDSPFFQQVGQGMAGGAILGPTLPAVAGAGRWAGGAVRGMLEPLTGSGQEKIVSRLLGNVANGEIKPDLSEIVPGSRPTLAEATGDPGLATLQRNVSTMPKLASAFNARAEQNSAARGELFDRLKGDDDTVQALRDARDAATAGKREAALSGQTQPADIKPVLDTIDTILKGPEGKRSEVVKALNEVKANLHDVTGEPETDAKMLYGVRKGIGDLLSPKASSDKRGAQLAAAELKHVQGALDTAIQDVAPGFKEYLANYAKLSKPIDEQQFLQSLRLTDRNQNLTLGRVQSALDRITDMRRKGGVNPAKSLSPETLTQLRALRDDLRRAGNIDLGKARGSDTVQNLATAELSNKLGIPLALGLGLHHPALAPAAAVGRMFYGVKSDQLVDRLGGKLLAPETVAAPVAKSGKPGARVLKRLAAPVVPAAGAMLANRILSPQ